MKIKLVMVVALAIAGCQEQVGMVSSSQSDGLVPFQAYEIDVNWESTGRWNDWMTVEGEAVQAESAILRIEYDAPGRVECQIQINSEYPNYPSLQNYSIIAWAGIEAGWGTRIIKLPEPSSKIWFTAGGGLCPAGFKIHKVSAELF